MLLGSPFQGSSAQMTALPTHVHTGAAPRIMRAYFPRRLVAHVAARPGKTARRTLPDCRRLRLSFTRRSRACAPACAACTGSRNAVGSEEQPKTAKSQTRRRCFSLSFCCHLLPLAALRQRPGEHPARGRAGALHAELYQHADRGAVGRQAGGDHPRDAGLLERPVDSARARLIGVALVRYAGRMLYPISTVSEPSERP